MPSESPVIISFRGFSRICISLIPGFPAKVAICFVNFSLPEDPRSYMLITISCVNVDVACSITKTEAITSR